MAQRQLAADDDVVESGVTPPNNTARLFDADELTAEQLEAYLASGGQRPC